MKVPDDVKNKIIELFFNTHMKSSKILELVAPNKEITLEDLYDILNEYQEKNGSLKRKRKLTEISEEELFELREQGLTYEIIAEHFANQGIKACKQTISDKCKKIYKEKGKEEPKTKTRKTKLIGLEEEIFKLREQGLTYESIVEHFIRQGIQVSVSLIQNRCKKIYKEKGKEEPKIRKTKLIGLEEEIFELREQGLSYEIIAEHFANQGIKACKQTISDKCKKIYKEKGKEEPKTKTRKTKLIGLEEEIFELREQGLQYESIVEHFIRKGKQVSVSLIQNTCKRIYKERGKEEPKIETQRTKLIELEEEIFKLREQGLSYERIAKHFITKGIQVSDQTISRKCKKIYKERGKEEPKTKIRKTKLIGSEEIFELREQGLTYKKIAEHFTNKGIQISMHAIRQKCKKIYKEKGKKEPKAVKTESTQLIDEEIIRLRAQGLSFRSIARCLNENGIKVTYETVRKRLSDSNQKDSKLLESTDVDTIKRLLLNLKYSKNATDEQLKKLAELYGVELNIEESIEL